MLPVPSGELARAADGAQPTFRLAADGGGRDDEQPVAGLQAGSRVGNETVALDRKSVV